jgi:hypothetical protein
MDQVPIQVEQLIFQIRDYRVMQDSDLAKLYEVETKYLLQMVKRNIERFPEDFMFQLSKEEIECLRLQIATSNKNKGRGGRRYLPYVFTENGVAMLSSVLRSKKAIQVNIGIMRVFNRFRHILESHQELANKLDELESKYDEDFKIVFEALRKLMNEPDQPKRKIGFHAENE